MQEKVRAAAADDDALVVCVRGGCFGWFLHGERGHRMGKRRRRCCIQGFPTLADVNDDAVAAVKGNGCLFSCCKHVKAFFRVQFGCVMVDGWKDCRESHGAVALGISRRFCISECCFGRVFCMHDCCSRLMHAWSFG